jgi:DNA polymerase I-like protein with 3'-5' exonuclease and polymerase domains
MEKQMNKYDVFGIEETRFPDFTPYRTLAIDLETYDPDIKKLGAGVRRDGYVVGIAIATYPDLKSYYFPIAHKRGTNFKREQIIEYLKPTLERKDLTLVGANLVYDIDYLIEMGFDIKARLRDVQIAEPLLDENKSSYKLEELGQFYFGEGKSEEKLEKWVRDYIGSKADVKGNIWQTPSEIVAEYARQDAVLPLRILKEQLKLIDAQGLRPLYDLESDILPLLIAMKRRGVHVNLNLADKLDAQFSESLVTDKKRLDEIAGFNVNYMSNDSLKFLCDQQGFSYSKTRTGKAQFQQAQIKNKIKTGTQQEQ